MTKITKATLKSFIKKNTNELYIGVKSSFDGMQDCVMDDEKTFSKAQFSAEYEKYNLGIKGLWLVGGSRNLFDSYEDETFKGIEVYNCCGSQILAVRK